MNKIVLITGATSGFGKAIALKFALEGYDVIITGRRKERLRELSDEIQNKHNQKALPLCFDVRDFRACKKAIESLSEKWKKVNLLVNNAGLAAGLDTIDNGKLDNWERMIDTNIKGLLYMTKLCIPLLKQTKGHIINIGSTAGKETYLNGNVYCATKHAVDSLTKAMRIDLLKHGIKVTGICPGAAETEFSVVRFDGDEQRAKDAYNGYTPMNADDIAEVAWFVASRPAHLCINDIVMTSTAQANSFYTNKKH